MATRDVELIVKARDQASAAAKTITDSFKKLAEAETQVGTSSEKTSTLLGQLKTELASLQASAGALSGFQKVATSIDRADAALIRLQTDAARAQDALQRSSLGAQSQSLALQRVKLASDAASESLARQKAALAALQEQQSRQQGSVNAARTIAPSVVPGEQAKLSEINAQVKAATSSVQQAQRAFTGLQKEVLSAERALELANAEFLKSSAVANAEAAAVNTARVALDALKVEAAGTGAALGGVAAQQDAITAASQRNAAALNAVAAAIANERRAIAQSSVSQTGGAAEQATAAYRAQVAALNSAKEAHRAATAEVQRLALAVKSAVNPTAELNANFTLAKAAAGQAKAAVASLEIELAKTKGSISAATAARQAAIASEQAEKAALEAATIAAQKYNNSLSGIIRNLIGLKRPADAAAASLLRAQQAAGRANAANPNQAFLGLTPSKLQNLSFQINDVITQLSSGTSIQQTLAQQSAQIGQLFPAFNNLLVTGLRMLPVLALIAAAFAPIIAAVGKLAGEAQATREFNTTLEATGRAAQISAEELTKTASAIDQYGGSLKEAIAVEQIFLNQGLAVEHFESLAIAARNLAPTLGVDVPAAARKLSEVLNGNLEDVLALDAQLNFLTATERERIRTLAESTDASTQSARASEQRQIVEGALLRQSQTIADNQRGPWSRAARELGRAWDDLVSAIANTGVFQQAGREIDNLANRVTSAARSFRVGLEFLTNGLNGRAAVDTVAASDRTRARPGGDPRDANSGVAQRAAEARAAAQREFNRELERTNAARTLELRIAGQSRPAQAAERAEFNLRQQAQRAGIVLSAEQIALTRESAAAEERGRAASRSSASEANSAANRQRAFNAELEKGNAERALQIELIGMTAREQAIETAVQQTRIRAEQQRVTATADQIEAVRASAAALFDAQQAEQQRNTILEQQIQLRGILRQQVSVEQQISEEALLANIDLTSEYGQAWARARTEVINAQRAVEALSKAQERVAALSAGLRNMERDFRQAREEGESAEQLRTRMEALEEQRRLLVEARDAAIQLALSLGDEAALERLRATNAEIRVQREEVLSTAEANKLISEGLTSAIGDATDQIGAAIEGTQSWGEAIQNIGDVFRQFAADFLKRIAMMIIQALILRAIQNSGWGGLISGAVGAATQHGGGMAGTGPKRSVSPAIFANAPRFHEGGIVGVGAGEVPSILQKGEEVLTKGDPRHAMNGGASPTVNIKNVNVVDGAEVLQHGLSDTAGERVMFNFIRRNKEAINAELQ